MSSVCSVDMNLMNTEFVKSSQVATIPEQDLSSTPAPLIQMRPDCCSEHFTGVSSRSVDGKSF